MTHKSLYKAIEDYDEVVMIDEQFTSLICPRCVTIKIRRIGQKTIIFIVNLVVMKTQTTTS